MILQSTVELAVNMELLRINSMDESCWPKPDDFVNCRDCFGTGKQENGDPCLFCLGHGTQERRELIAQTIASYGDDLEFGGPNCRKAFKAVVDAYVLLNLWVPEVGSIPILGAGQKSGDQLIQNDKLRARISHQDLVAAIKKL